MVYVRSQGKPMVIPRVRVRDARGPFLSVRLAEHGLDIRVNSPTMSNNTGFNVILQEATGSTCREQSSAWGPTNICKRDKIIRKDCNDCPDNIDAGMAKTRLGLQHCKLLCEVPPRAAQSAICAYR